MKRSKKFKKKRKNKSIIIILFILILTLGITIYYYPKNNIKLPKKEQIETMYLANTTQMIPIYKLETTTQYEEEKNILII